jgi:membrane-bound serine protease (ClpP class)
VRQLRASRRPRLEAAVGLCLLAIASGALAAREATTASSEDAALEGGTEASADAGGEAAPPRRGKLYVATITGSINPASGDYLIQAIQRAEAEGAAALLIDLDTPGGLVSSTKDILQAMLNARVPIIVYVSPRGAWAGSAGTFITVAAHVAAMAPGTSIGAASPVSIGGGGSSPPSEGEEGKRAPRDTSMEKAENLLAAYMESIAKRRNRNVEWVGKSIREAEAIGEEEALELNVIDVIAEDRADLLEAIEGRRVELVGGPVSLAVRDARVVQLEMGYVQRLFDFLADPNVAVVLFLAGLIGIYVEVNNPGMVVPGVMGLVCLVLTAIAFQILPFSWVGLILILAGVGLFIAELFVASFGLLFVAGIACLLLGGTMVFDRPELSDLTVDFWRVLVPTVVALSLFGAVVVFLIGRTFGLRQTSGVDELVGLVGRSTTRLDPSGRVFVRGEYWSVDADEPVEEGEPVQVVGVEGMRLRVRRLENG